MIADSGLGIKFDEDDTETGNTADGCMARHQKEEYCGGDDRNSDR